MIQNTESSINRRGSDRATVSIAVKGHIGKFTHIFQANNISPDGIFLASVSSRDFPDQSRCALEFSLPGSPIQISVRGQLVRQARHDRYQLAAIKFLAIAPSHRRLIRQYIENPALKVPIPPYLSSSATH